MTTLSLANLSHGQTLTDALKTAGDVSENPRFLDAMARNKVDWVNASGHADAVAQAQAVPPVQAPKPAEAVRSVASSDPSLENNVTARDRVRRSLELNGAEPAAGGDLILNGLNKLRGAFDAQHHHIAEIMEGNVVDPKTLLAMQMELAQYTVMVDVSSKLTGKAAQSLDTLMKGQ